MNHSSYRFRILITMLAVVSLCNAQFTFRNGDLIFSVGKSNSDMQAAIQHATAQPSQLPYTHVGIVLTSNDSVYVIEATTPQGVQKVTLQEFMADVATHKNKIYAAVGRIKIHNLNTIEKALKYAQANIGSAYDYVYNESNNAFYCSELVRKSFLAEDGSYLFPAIKMTFKDQQTGHFHPYWVKHFNVHHTPIPEGQPGTNPSQLAQSDVIEIVHRFF